jgi:hypothetical protein
LFFLLPKALKAMSTQLFAWVHPSLALVKCKNSDVWIRRKSLRNQSSALHAPNALRPLGAEPRCKSPAESHGCSAHAGMKKGAVHEKQGALLQPRRGKPRQPTPTWE